MSYINLRVIAILTVVSLISAYLLSSVYEKSYPRIIKNIEEDLEKSMRKIIPNMSRKEELKEIKDVYKIYDKNDKFLGYIFIAEGQGYQDKIKIVGGLSKDLDRMLGIEIIESKETPGLGAKINSDNFKNQFHDLEVSVPIEYIKYGNRKPNQIQAITSATISSAAVVKILNKKIQEIKEVLKSE